LPGSADDDPTGPVGAVDGGFTQVRPTPQLIFGRPITPSPHDSPSFAPLAPLVPSCAAVGVAVVAGVVVVAGVALLVVGDSAGGGFEAQPARTKKEPRQRRSDVFMGAP